MSLERRAFALRHMYVYPRLRIAYTYVPKNACSSFKGTFSRAQGWLADDAKSVHPMKPSRWLSGLVRYPAAEERIVVIRDPFDRIVSGYLNRFLMPRVDAAVDHAMSTGLADLLPPGSNRGDVTFADFVEYLAKTPSASLNEHWRPQNDFLIGSYTRIIRFDHIAEDAAFLSDRGLPLMNRRGHSTSALRQNLGPGWGSRKARFLRRLRNRKGILPSPDSMYDDRLRAVVSERYAEDVDLFQSVRGTNSRTRPAASHP